MATTLQKPATRAVPKEPDAATPSAIVHSLNRQLAHAIDLQLQAKHAHWNVKGMSFAALHDLFEQVAVAAANHADLLAERAVQLGGLADGDVRAVAKSSELPRYPSQIVSGPDHVKALAAALSSFAAAIRPGIDEASRAGDVATEDILVEVLRETDKLRWLVEAHIQGER